MAAWASTGANIDKFVTVKIVTIKFVGNPSVKNDSDFLKLKFKSIWLEFFFREMFGSFDLFVPQVLYRDAISDKADRINLVLLICRKHDQMIVYVGVNLFVLYIHLVRLYRHLLLHNYEAHESVREIPWFDQMTLQKLEDRKSFSLSSVCMWRWKYSTNFYNEIIYSASVGAENCAILKNYTLNWQTGAKKRVKHGWLDRELTYNTGLFFSRTGNKDMLLVNQTCRS